MTTKLANIQKCITFSEYLTQLLPLVHNPTSVTMACVACLTLIGSRGGGKITPQTDLFTAAPKPLGIKSCALVTFPVYGWATKWTKKICPATYRKSNMATGSDM